MNIFIASTLSFAAGLGIGLVLLWFRRNDAGKMAAFMLSQKQEEMDKTVSHMRDAFSTLSLEALQRNTEQFLSLAAENLDKKNQAGSQDLGAKKDMIDQTLKTMKGELDKVQGMVQTIEKDRKAKFDVLSTQLKSAAEETKQLRDTTHALKSALSNSQIRGQWGERMAEDVLRLAGFQEGINYLKQQQTEKKSRPDYTFYMPQNRVVHMDVKFPLDNYLAYMDSESETEKKIFLKSFISDARRRVDEVTKRDYVDTTQDTLDYVIVFIPNEQVYTFLHEQDRTLVDMALGKKVILCSPITLYAILAVIRQAVDNFQMEQKAGEILKLIEKFGAQWGKFTEAIDKVGKKLEDSNKAFLELSTTRRNQIEKPLREIEALRQSDKIFKTSSGQPLELIENPDEKKEEKS